MNALSEPRATGVDVTEDSLFVELIDGRTVSVPLVWYPRLLRGTAEERSCWEFIGGGEGNDWPLQGFRSPGGMLFLTERRACARTVGQQVPVS
jgi:hypothetical protein